MIKIKDLARQLKPSDIGEWILSTIAFLMVIALIITMLFLPAAPVRKAGHDANILILRESIVFDPHYGNVLLIDYMIDGWQTNAFFRPGEEEKIDKFWAELDKLGEVQR